MDITNLTLEELEQKQEELLSQLQAVSKQIEKLEMEEESEEYNRPYEIVLEHVFGSIENSISESFWLENIKDSYVLCSRMIKDEIKETIVFELDSMLNNVINTEFILATNQNEEFKDIKDEELDSIIENIIEYNSNLNINSDNILKIIANPENNDIGSIKVIYFNKDALEDFSYQEEIQVKEFIFDNSYSRIISHL